MPRGGTVPGSMLGAPDGAVGYLDNNGDSVVLDLTDTLRVGDVLRMRLRPALSTGFGATDGSRQSGRDHLDDIPVHCRRCDAVGDPGRYAVIRNSQPEPEQGRAANHPADIAVDAVTYFTG